MDLIRLRSRLESLKSDKASTEQAWDQIEQFIMPITGQTNDSGSSSPQTSEDVWDLTGPLACEHLAASLHGSVTSPAARWVDFEFQDEKLEQDQEAVKVREAMAQIGWSELQSSDFNMEISSAYHEYAGLGAMCLMVEVANSERWEGLDFTAIPVREAFYEQDSKGGVKTFFRALKWTPVQIVDKFGRDNVPENVRVRADSPQGGTERLDVVFCVYRREEIPITAGEDGQPLVPEQRPFGAVYFLRENAERLGEELGYYEMPVVIGVWGRRPGYAWGFGRGHLALRNVKFLNRYKELARAAGARAVEPPLFTTERGLLGDLHHEPAGVSVVGDLDAVKAFDGNGRFDVAVEVMRDERSEIRRAFHEDDLQLKESPAMTATEVQARRDMMDRVLGSPVGRLQTDVLAPIVNITLRMLARAGRLPPLPAALAGKGADVRVKFRGPISRAQMMDEVVGIEREAAFVANLLQMGFQEASDWFDVGQAIREHSKRVGAPASMMRSAEYVKKLQANRAAEQKAMAQAEIAKTQTEAMKNAAMAQAQAPFPTGAGFGIAPQPAFAPSGALAP